MRLIKHKQEHDFTNFSPQELEKMLEEGEAGKKLTEQQLLTRIKVI